MRWRIYICGCDKQSASYFMGLFSFDQWLIRGAGKAMGNDNDFLPQIRLQR
jgi:hypothetical protein